MPQRPTGTVTFLFTDVEGSTRLLKELRDRYGVVLAEHQRVLRDAFEAHGGEEIDTQGDAFFYAFARARDAVAAAVEAQRALAGHAWPEGAEFRVRMGLHTGEPVLSDEGRYHGLGVHRAARIMAAAHGGQVVTSQATASVLGDEELEGVALRDLGEHRLKDLDRPEQIYQLEIEGLESTFPPLRTEASADELVAPVRAPLYRRPLVIGAFAGVIAAAIAIPIFALGGGSGGSALHALTANSVGIVDARSGRILDDVEGIATPGRVAAGAGAIWVTSPDAQTVTRLDPRSHEVRQTIHTGSGPAGVVVAGDDVWVANTLDGTVSRIDASTNQVVQTIAVGNSPTAVAYGAGSVWVTNLDDQTLSRIDPRQGRVVQTSRVDAAARGVAVGGGAVWVSDGARNRVMRIDPRTGAVVQAINVGSGPTAIVYGAGSAWVANSLDGTVSQIDPSANVVRATIPVGSAPNALAVSGNDVWVADEAGERLVRIDAKKGSVATTVGLGSRPGGLALDGSLLWVSGQGATTAHRGGTLRMRAQFPLDSIDPSTAYSPDSWPILSITNDGLVAFKHVGGGDGTQLVPDLATSVPAPTDDGKTYTFQLRRGVRFSNGKLVTPEDVRRSIEREFAIPGGGFGASYFAAIRGAAACIKAPARCDLRRGIVTDSAQSTVTFHLTKPDPELLYKLAVPPGAVVPAAAPRHESKTALPATGPYMFARSDPKRRLRLVRNPHFRVWSAAAKPDGYPDELLLVFDKDVEAEVTAVERGRTDVAYSGIPAGRLAELTTQYAAQLHVTPHASTIYLQMNTREPPFDDVRVRRALNYAIDRGAIIKLGGGPIPAQPTCQILPPNFPGYKPYCPYTLRPVSGGAWTAPDLVKARALVRASGTRGMRVTLWTCDCISKPAVARIERATLKRLGYRVTLKVIPGGEAYFAAIYDTLRARPQIAATGWFADYPAASNFFDLLRCAGAGPALAAVNGSRFCDPAIDRQIDRALSLQPSDPRASSDLWQRIDQGVVDRAPWVPLYTARAIDFVSARVGNYQRHPLFGMLLDQFWVK